jgi:hypothetical protein
MVNMRDDRDVAQVIAGQQGTCGHQEALPVKGVFGAVAARPF